MYKGKEFKFKDVFNKGIDLSANEFANDVWGKDNPLAFTVQVNDSTLFVCSCGEHERYSKREARDKDLRTCPKCGQSSVYEMYEVDYEEAFHKTVKVEETDDMFILTATQYNVRFAFSEIVISVGGLVEIEIAKDGSSAKTEWECELTDFADYFYYENDKDTVLSDFLEKNFPLIKNIIDEKQYDFRYSLIFMYLAINKPALRQLEVVEHELINKELKSKMNYLSLRYLNDEDFDFSKDTIGGVFGIDDEIVHGITGLEKGESVKAFRDFYQRSKDANATTYIDNYIKSGGTISLTDTEKLEKLYNEIAGEVEKDIFFRYLFSNCSESNPISYALRHYCYVLDNGQGIVTIDYNKQFRNSMYDKVESIKRLEDSNLMTREQYLSILKKPSLSSFLKATKG